MPQYLLLICDNETRMPALSKEEFGAELGQYMAFGKEHAASLRGGNPLQPTGTAKTVRVRDGQVIATDGPFAETKEQLGGYYVAEADTIDEAAAIAAKIPGARFGSVEVRPVLKF